MKVMANATAGAFSCNQDAVDYFDLQWRLSFDAISARKDPTGRMSGR
jgi:hypothetical protein